MAILGHQVILVGGFADMDLIWWWDPPVKRTLSLSLLCSSSLFPLYSLPVTGLAPYSGTTTCSSPGAVVVVRHSPTLHAGAIVAPVWSMSSLVYILDMDYLIWSIILLVILDIDLLDYYRPLNLPKIFINVEICWPSRRMACANSTNISDLWLKINVF